MSVKPRFGGAVRLATIAAAIVATGCASTAMSPVPDEPEGDDFGVLVMAHGGTEDWNEAVLEATELLEQDYPVEVAFGMAAAGSLQEATSKLEAQGVQRIGVLRLFVSGESWYERTRQILGIEAGAPSREEAPPGHGGHHDFAATFWQIDTDAAFAMSTDGLLQAEGMTQVLLDRARDLTEDAERESVLIIAHGPGDDLENERWIAALEQLAAPIRKEPYRAVEVHTLREDWSEKREISEQRIRSFVETANEDAGRCIVIPFRVFGFGPYAEVLEGLDYVSDGRGLLPHDAVPAWMARQAAALQQGPFEPAGDR